MVVATAEIVRLALPVLVTVKPSGALVLPTFCFANAMVDVLKVAAGPGVTDVPVKVTECDPGVPESVSLMVAVNAPVVPVGGLNWTVT